MSPSQTFKEMSLSPKIVINDRFLKRQLNQENTINIVKEGSVGSTSSEKFTSGNYVPILATTDGASNNEADQRKMKNDKLR